MHGIERIASKLKMWEPTMLPIARSVWPLIELVIDFTSSGRLVPVTIRPMTMGQMSRPRTVAVDLLTNRYALHKRIRNPTKSGAKRRSSGSIQSVSNGQWALKGFSFAFATK
tara:strand:+ start:162 stop:497 length:336 start_codon:yes stop_codon:yes gene_type:complete